MALTPRPFEVVTDRLQKYARGAALCPAHDDRAQSLSVKEAEDGRVLVNCHAGCSFDEIASALGLQAMDFFPEKQDAPSTVAGEYKYVDEAGELLYVVERLVPKSFRQKRWTGSGFEWKLGEVRRVPYRLPQILEAKAKGKPVLIVEGEKDVHTLEKMGFIATCNAGGAGGVGKGKFEPEWKELFSGMFVAVIPDNDDPGFSHANEVCKLLSDVSQVKFIELGGEKGADVTDWFRSGYGAEDLKNKIRNAPDFKPKTFTGLSVSRVADVAVEKIEWLWHGYIPFGKLTVLEGDPGLGKSTVTLDLAARISTGGFLPDDTRTEAPGDVLLISSEDGIADTVRPRLEAAEADLTRVHVITGLSEGGMVRIPEDLPKLEALINDVHAHLVVIDPLVAFLGEGIDSHRDQDVRRALHPLTEMANRTKAAFILMRHLNKGSGKAMYRGGGSIGITGAVRSGIVIAPDPEEPQYRVLAVFKSNLAKTPESLRFRLTPDDLRGVAKVSWFGGCNHTADDIVNPTKKSARGEIFA